MGLTLFRPLIKCAKPNGAAEAAPTATYFAAQFEETSVPGGGMSRKLSS
jgi:hypothetical protein